MCLLVVLHRVHSDAPLLVAANRDELLSRAATAMTVLRHDHPRILGGRDEVAGGTWLAVNELGLVAALTNRPSGQRDPSKRSRGEWPVFLAGFASPLAAVTAFLAEFDPAHFNPGWVLVGDGRDLVYVDMTDPGGGRHLELEPGIHILENRPLDGESAKADLVRRRLAGIEALRGDELVERLTAVLASHRTPEQALRGASGDSTGRPAAAEAACVHLGAYGTRSATIIRASRGTRPTVWSADGPPCTHSFVEVTDLWRSPQQEVAGV